LSVEFGGDTHAEFATVLTLGQRLRDGVVVGAEVVKGVADQLAYAA